MINLNLLHQNLNTEALSCAELTEKAQIVDRVYEAVYACLPASLAFLYDLRVLCASALAVAVENETESRDARNRRYDRFALRSGVGANGRLATR